MKHLLLLTLTLLAAAAALFWTSTSDPTRPAAAPTGAATPVAEPAPAALAFHAHRTAVRTLYDLAPGEEISLVCRLASTTTVRQDVDAAGQALELAFQGECKLRVLARRGEEWIAELSLAAARVALSVSGRAGDTAGLADDLRKPLTIRMGAAGEVLGYRFADGVCAEHRNVLRSLFSALRAPVAAGEWRGREGDGGGVSELVTSRRDVGADIALSWDRRGYEPRPDGRDVPSLTGRGTATAEHGAPWWRETSYSETQAVRVRHARVEIRLNLTVESHLLSVAGAPATNRDELWEGAWQPASGGDEGDEVLAAREREQWEREVASLTVSDVVAELARLAAGDEAASAEAFAARERIVWLVRLRPEVVGELAALLLDPSVDTQLSAMLAGALGAAATPEAQRVLVDVARAESLPLGRRNGAIVALVQVEGPLTEVSATLLDFAERTSENPTLRGTSMLVVGAMSSRAGAEPTLLPRLLVLESAAELSGSIPAWLGALGNTGSREVLGPAFRHAADQREDVRIAALGAVRRVQRTEATDLLLHHATADRLATVRARAIELLAERTDSRALPAIERALADASEFVRRTAVLAVAQRGAPGARELLHNVARNDPSDEVRRLASEALGQLVSGT